MSSKEITKSLQLIVAGLAGLLILYGIFYILHKKYGGSDSLGIEGFDQQTLITQNTDLKTKIGSTQDCLNMINAYKENIQLKTLQTLITPTSTNIDTLLNNLSIQLNSLDRMTTYVNSFSTQTTTTNTPDPNTFPTTQTNVFG